MRLPLKLILRAALVAPWLAGGAASAQPIENHVMQVAATKQNAVAAVGNRLAQVIYVQRHNGCDQVAVQWKGMPQQNFEVCQGQARDKRTVAPSWPTNGNARDLLSLVVENALVYGQSQSTDENGYLITARRLPDVGRCSLVEVLVAYQGDLSDRATRKICR